MFECWCSIFSIFFGIPVTLIVINKIIRSLKISNIQEKWIFITGCDSGFGRAFALRAAREKIPVIAGCLTEDGASTLLDEVKQFNGQINTVIVDVSDDISVKNAVEKVEEILNNKNLWAVINNAGILYYEGAAEWIPIESYQNTFNVITCGAIRICNAFLPLLRKSKGRIITTTSVTGRIAIPPMTTYTVAKYALEGYMDILRREVRHFGITCVIIEPDVHRTPMALVAKQYPHSKQAFDSLPKHIKEAYGEEYLHKIDSQFYNVLEEKANPNVDEVIDAYYHAVTSRFPYVRYAVGLAANLIYIPSSLLPGLIQDLIVRLATVDPAPKFEIKKGK